MEVPPNSQRVNDTDIKRERDHTRLQFIVLNEYNSTSEGRNRARRAQVMLAARFPQATWLQKGTAEERGHPRSLNLLPEELVHVGDGDNDRKAAQEFGCIFIGVCDSADGPDGKWAGAPFTLVSDMHAACAKICELAGVPARG